MLERWGPGAWWKLPRGMCSQRAGCNPGTAKADGQRAWWQLRLECSNNRAMCRQRAGCNAGTAKADGWNSKSWRPEGLVEAAARELEGFKRFKGFKRLKPGKRLTREGYVQANAAKADGQRAWWKLPRGNWRVLRVLSVWSLANGRLECPNKRGLGAGKWGLWSLANRFSTDKHLLQERPWTMWRPWPGQSRFHTSGGPRRRPYLGEGRVGGFVYLLIYLYDLYL